MNTHAATMLPDGVVTVAPARRGWYLVSIGRSASTKQFNLTQAQAAALVAELCRTVPGALAAAAAVAGVPSR